MRQSCARRPAARRPALVECGRHGHRRIEPAHAGALAAQGVIGGLEQCVRLRPHRPTIAGHGRRRRRHPRPGAELQRLGIGPGEVVQRGARGQADVERQLLHGVDAGTWSLAGAANRALAAERAWPRGQEKQPGQAWLRRNAKRLILVGRHVPRRPPLGQPARHGDTEVTRCYRTQESEGFAPSRQGRVTKLFSLFQRNPKPEHPGPRRPRRRPDLAHSPRGWNMHKKNTLGYGCTARGGIFCQLRRW